MNGRLAPILLALLSAAACGQDTRSSHPPDTSDAVDDAASDCSATEDTYRFQLDPITGAPFHWELPACIQYAIAVPGPKSLDPTDLALAVDTAIGLWAEPVCSLPCTVSAGTAAPDDWGYDPEKDDQQTLLYWVDSESLWLTRHSEAAIAITTIVTQPSTGRILDADIEFNDFGDHLWTLDEGQPSADVISIVAHEFGHVLGLAHATDADSLMSSPWRPGWIHRWLSDGDRVGVCALYSCFEF